MKQDAKLHMHLSEFTSIGISHAFLDQIKHKKPLCL